MVPKPLNGKLGPLEYEPRDQRRKLFEKLWSMRASKRSSRLTPLPVLKKLLALVKALVGTAFGLGKYFSMLSATGSMRLRGMMLPAKGCRMKLPAASCVTVSGS